MKKIILLLLIFAFLLPYNNTNAQQKYKIVKEVKWKSDLWVNYVSLGGYIGGVSGYRFDLLFLRYKYFSIGYVSVFRTEKYGDVYNIPLGLYYPIYTGGLYQFGININFYLFPSVGDLQKEENIPPLVDFSLRFDTWLFSISAGYIYHSENFKREHYNSYPIYYDEYRYDGIFLEGSIGFMGFLNNKLFSKNKKTIVTRKIHIPNPSLRIESNFSDYKNSIIGDEEKDLHITIENKGKGLAEDVKLKIIMKGLLTSDLSFKRTHNLWDIQPYSNKTIDIPIKAKKDLEKIKKVTISVECNEKDGFKASDNFELTLIPYMAKEKFPPVLTVDATLKEPSGNMLLDALEKGEIEITVKNNGRGNAWGIEPVIDIEESNITKYLNFEIDSSNIRKVEPDGSTKITIPVSTDWDVPSGKVMMHILIKEGNGFDAAPVNFSFQTHKFLKPKLIITDIGIDDSESENTFGDGDNIIENMETIEVTTIIQNQGQGKAKDVKAKIKVGDGNISFFGDDLYSLGDLEPGEFEIVKFALWVNNKYSGSLNLPITMDITEDYKRYGISRKNLGLELNKITFAAKDIDIEGKRYKWREIPDTPELTVDIEKDFPDAEISRRKGIAVIIGNRDYEFYPDNPVEFAINDRNLAERYSKDVFGFRTVLGSENLGFAQFRNIFGTEDNSEGELYRTLRVEEPVFIYITGHGHSKPQLNKKAVSYIVPKDGNSYDLDATCYPIDILYNNLSYLIEKKKPEKLILIIDMCFSGYLTTAISSARWESENPLHDLIDIGKKVGTEVVCIFATQEAQTAKWYQSKKHSLLTYFVLKAFHNSENEGGYKADLNNDKKLTIRELKDFVLDENYGVPYFANQREVVGDSDLGQLPVIIGDDDIILIQYK